MEIIELPSQQFNYHMHTEHELGRDSSVSELITRPSSLTDTFYLTLEDDSPAIN